MKYQVRITEKAEDDVAAILLWFREHGALAAGGKWFVQLMAAIDTLETMPQRCGLAAEAAAIGMDVREVLVGKRRGTYRVLFQMRGHIVHILRVWHSARDAVSRNDV